MINNVLRFSIFLPKHYDIKTFIIFLTLSLQYSQQQIKHDHPYFQRLNLIFAILIRGAIAPAPTLLA